VVLQPKRRRDVEDADEEPRQRKGHDRPAARSGQHEHDDEIDEVHCGDDGESPRFEIRPERIGCGAYKVRV
jgi:hypothetical protein